MEIKGVQIKPMNYELLYNFVADLMSTGERKYCHFVTINPEFIVESTQSMQFKEVLNRAELTLIDGIGLLAAVDYQNKPIHSESIARMVQFGVSCVDVGVLRQKVFVDGVRVERITGIDMIYWLCGQPEMRGRKVFLLGGMPVDVVEKAKVVLSRDYPEVMFECDPGHQNIREVMSQQVSGIDAESERIVAKINEYGAEVLLVAYGHPWQDLWLDKVRNELRTVRLAGGVGGAFDFIVGNVSRAPEWMRSRGLEWIYRLGEQPERLPRILNATWRFGRILTE